MCLNLAHSTFLSEYYKQWIKSRLKVYICEVQWARSRHFILSLSARNLLDNEFVRFVHCILESSHRAIFLATFSQILVFFQNLLNETIPTSACVFVQKMLFYAIQFLGFTPRHFIDRQRWLVFIQPIRILFICCVYFTLIMKLQLCMADQQSALSFVWCFYLITDKKM